MLLKLNIVSDFESISVKGSIKKDRVTYKGWCPSLRWGWSQRAAPRFRCSCFRPAGWPVDLWLRRKLRRYSFEAHHLNLRLQCSDCGWTSRLSPFYLRLHASNWKWLCLSSQVVETLRDRLLPTQVPMLSDFLASGSRQPHWSVGSRKVTVSAVQP